MKQEHRYSLTRVCLRRGELSLPRSLRGVFPEDSVIKAVDSASGNEFELKLQGNSVLTGMDAFFSEHGLEVNDTVMIRPSEDGTVTLTPVKREKQADYSSPAAARKIVEAVLQAGPVTEAEARALLKGLPADFNLAGVLQASGKLTLKAGRWQSLAALRDRDFDRQVEETFAQAAATTPKPAARTTADAGGLTVLAGLGFRLQDLGDGSWLLDATTPGATAPGFKAVMHQLSGEGRLDWAKLLEARRQHAADYLAVTGPAAQLPALKAPAELAHASLWDGAALDRIAEISLTVPLGPADLESHFRHDGFHGAGLERFERTVADRIAERGAFSTVLTNLSALPGACGFRLEDAARGIDREAAARVLDQLSRSPFQLVLRREGGDWYLRQNVQQGLQQLAEYANSLQEQLPRTGRQAAALRSRFQTV